MIDKAREVALKTLYKIDKEGAYSNIALDEMLNQNRKDLNSKDIGLISEIVYGVTTWRLTLDEIIKKYSNIKLKKISPFIINILRMSIYQIIFLDKIPKSAAVNEGVNLSKRYGHKGSSGFVNAVLRKVTKEDYEELMKNLNDFDATRLSKATSMPVWIIEELKKDDLSMDQIKEICINSNIRPKLSIRVNTLKISKQNLKQKLEGKGIEVEDGVLDDFLILNKTKNIENMQEFKEGLFTIQDEVAGLPALVLNPQKNERILDACSAPGGKTTYLAQLAPFSKIEAWDIHEHRVKLVEETANRLGITNIETQVKDAIIYEEKYFEKFDKILLDVPCLGIGVLKRKPDIKWQRKKDDIEEIRKLQMQILQTCSKYLKKNGELIYSTCSIFNEENENVVLQFVKNNKNFDIEKINLTNFFEKYLDKNFLKVYQNMHTDGFFVSKVVKK